MARRAEIKIYTALKDAGFKKAEKGLKNLRFQANGLNRTLAKLGAGVAVTEFARRSVDAAIKMEAANAKLSVALTSVGKASALNGASIRKTSEQMSNLGFQGTATAEALANLVTITGSLEKAQSLMGASADAARYLNVGLAEGAAKLGSAFGGSAKALQVFNIKLDKTLKPAEAFDKAMGMLNAKIGGQAAAFATTYAGKLQILAARFEEVQVQVGQKLLPYLVKLGDYLVTTGIPRLESFFTVLEDNKSTVVGMTAAITTMVVAMKGLATYATLTNKAMIPFFGAAAPFIAGLTALAGVTALVKSSPIGQPAGVPLGVGQPMGRGTNSIALQQQNLAGTRGGFKGSPIPGMNKGKAGVDLQALQTAKGLAATQKAALALAKKEAAIKAAEKRKVDAEKKLSAMFDLNQIALANALKLNLTEKEKAAVLGLQALEDDGYKTEEQRMLAQEAALRKLISLKGDYASMAWDKTASLGGGEKQVSTPQTTPLGVTGAVQDIVAKQVEMMSPGALVSALQMSNATPGGGTNTMVSGMPGLAEAEAAATKAMAGANTGSGGVVVNVNVAGTVTSEQDLLNTIYEGLGNKLRGGAAWYQNAASG